ncbi:MAG: trypsin-like serine peptidase, partial [Beijerinckiaceae bacterium]
LSLVPKEQVVSGTAVITGPDQLKVELLPQSIVRDPGPNATPAERDMYMTLSRQVRQIDTRAAARLGATTAAATAGVPAAQTTRDVRVAVVDAEQELKAMCVGNMTQTAENIVLASMSLTTAADGLARTQAAQGIGRISIFPKAVYGADDSYNLCSFTYAGEMGGAAVALVGGGGGTGFCSGFLIAPDLVLTALHCMAKRDGAQMSMRDAAEISELMVRIGDFKGSSAIPALRRVRGLVFPAAAVPADLAARVQNADFAEDLPDFAILRIEPVEETQPIPLCDSHHRQLGDGMMVVGYPGGEAGRVIDNARLLLPPLASTYDRSVALCAIASPLLRLKESMQGVSPAQRGAVLTALDEALRSMQRAYRKTGDSWRLVHPGYGRGGMPAMVLDPDASRGYSGAPVIDRRRMCAAGIFVAGAGDRYVEQANWFAHEIGVPMEFIRAHVAAASPALSEEIARGQLAALKPPPACVNQ